MSFRPRNENINMSSDVIHFKPEIMERMYLTPIVDDVATVPNAIKSVETSLPKPKIQSTEHAIALARAKTAPAKFQCKHDEMERNESTLDGYVYYQMGGKTDQAVKAGERRSDVVGSRMMTTSSKGNFNLAPDNKKSAAKRAHKQHASNDSSKKSSLRHTSTDLKSSLLRRL